MEEDLCYLKNQKKQRGQYFTKSNPFDTDLFREWFQMIPEEQRKDILEPFAGQNGIVRMLKEMGVEASWHCYDINPAETNLTPQFRVNELDVLKDFPSDARVAITNPPYLAKNSAHRAGMSYEYPEFDDLYKKCLDVMLKNCGYVCAIIPQSFVTSELFLDRLYAVQSLTVKMFDDTECPVCLAYFIPEEQKKVEKNSKTFLIFRNQGYINTCEQLSGWFENIGTSADWTFNDPDGTVGIWCIDNNKSPTIRFVKGDTIKSQRIKVSSRSFTRVSGLDDKIDLGNFLDRCNEILTDYRLKTQDVFLTSFKGLRKDGMYRRRLDFKTAKIIMNKALSQINKTN